MTNVKHITLSQLQGKISLALAEALPLSIWVCAEVADIKINASGHCYIELIEKDEKSGATLAQAKATIWRSQVPITVGRFERESGQQLSKGMMILFQTTVSHHAVYGMSLQIQNIDALYTIGDMERRRQQTIEQLQKEGVWNNNRSQEMPTVVQRIAVISSATAAGYQDFMMELSRSKYTLNTELFEATMQGEGCEQSVMAAMMAVAERSDEFDAVAIIRGGGSTSDLECFNSYLISLCVAQFPLPVLTGIGHDKDVSVVDMVAAVPLKTPTAVAAWICATAERFDGELEYAALMLRDSCRKASHNAELRMERLSEQLRRVVETTLIRQAERLDGFSMLIDNFAPARLLELGFAVARGQSGAIRSINEVETGEDITIEVADGEIRATIVEKYGKEG